MKLIADLICNAIAEENKDTLPETNSSHLKMDGWNTTFLLERPIFRGYVSFREGKTFDISKCNRFWNCESFCENNVLTMCFNG